MLKYSGNVKNKKMFEKLLAVIPYNPGLLPQMRFYAQRMHEEAAIRRIGLVFLVLAFLIQFFAVLNPPQSTLAANDDNSLINGGISSPQEAANKCAGNIRDYKTIMAFYGISCDALRQGVPVSINSEGPKLPQGKEFFSMGWISYKGKNPGTHEHAVNIPGAGTLYLRRLDSFDSGGLKYDAMRVKAADGTFYRILYSCGNLVSVGLPTPYTPPKAPNNPLPSLPAQPAPLPSLPPASPPPATPPVTPPKTCEYNPALPADSPQCYKPCEFNPSIPADSSLCFKPCQYNPTIPTDDQNCKPCDKGSTKNDTVACVSVHKKASNITANISDANGTTAQPGNVINYTLSATNSGKSNVKGFIFQESLSDVLDYADVVDLHGGTLDRYNVVSWPEETIGAGATATHQVTVKVKDPIPATPADPANPEHFNLTMTNVYGDVVNIKVPAPPVKAIQTVAASLPNTGPGTTMAITATIVIMGGYFYGRARLLARESTLAVQENTQG